MTEQEARWAEREAIVLWIGRQALNDKKFTWPYWKLFLWGIFNYGKLCASHAKAELSYEAMTAIERGDHLDQ